MKSGKALARAIRRSARERMRSSKALWQDYRRMRWARWRRLQIKRWVIILYPVLLVAVVGRNASSELLFVLLSLYCTATIFVRSVRFETTLYRSADLALFMLFPVKDSNFFDYEWARFLRSSLLVWFSAASVFVLLVFRQHSPYGKNLVVALVAATLQWLLVVTFCVILHLLPQRFMSGRVGFLLYALAFSSIFLPGRLLETLKTVVALLPTAWIPWVFERGVLAHDASALPRVIGAAVLVAFLPLGYQRLRKAYPRVELVYPLLGAGAGVLHEEEGFDEDSRESTGNETGDLGLESVTRKTVAAPAPIHLPFLDWETSGWIERLAGRWLNRREQQVAAFLCGGRLGHWSKSWRFGLKVAAVGIVTMFLTMLLPLWVCFVAGLAATLSAVPVFGGRWDGLQLTASSGTVGPAYAGLPISYSEITRVLFKINLVRYAVWIPVFLLYAAALGALTEHSWSLGLRMGLEILAILLSAQWIFIMGHHASGTNDTKRLTWHSLVGIVTVLLISMLYIVCFCSFIFAMGLESSEPGVGIAAASLVGMIIFSWLDWFVYKLFYNRGRIDLMRLPS